MQPKGLVFSLLGTALLSPGCASIVSSTSDPITINSIPDAADFVVKTDKGTVVHKGTTPASVVLEKGEGYFNGYDYNIELSKPGYSSKTVQLTTGAGGWYVLGNLVIRRSYRLADCRPCDRSHVDLF